MEDNPWNPDGIGMGGIDPHYPPPPPKERQWSEICLANGVVIHDPAELAGWLLAEPQNAADLYSSM